jgi:anaerobic selenocysteine-containing dehydrogenase
MAANDNVVTKKTFCRICSAFCGMEVDVVDNRVVAVRGDTSDALSGGYTCVKGRQIPDQMNGERLLASMKRQPDGSYAPIDREVALDEIAERIRTLNGESGARAIATYIGTMGAYSAGSYAVVRSWMAALGSPQYFTSLSIDQLAKVYAVARMGVWGGGLQRFETADVVMVIGNNPLVSGLAVPGAAPGFNPSATLDSAKRRGLKVICVDPRRTELAKRADLHLQLRPGSDAALLAGMVRVILDEKLHDQEFCDQWAEGLAELRQAIDSFTPEVVEAHTDIPAALMIEAARLFAAGPRGIVGSGTGPNMAPFPNTMEVMVATLNVICGRVCREGEEANTPQVLGQELPRPAQVFPPEFLPDNIRLDPDAPASRIRGIKQVCGEMPTPVLAEEILQPGDGQVRALFCVGGNPMAAWPDQQKTERALEELDLLVTLDVRMTGTAKRSDYVLACQLPLERDDLTEFTSLVSEEPFGMYAHAVVDAPEGLFEEQEVFLGLGKRLGFDMEISGEKVDFDALATRRTFLEQVYRDSRVPVSRFADADGGLLCDDARSTVSEPIEGIEGRFLLALPDVLRELGEIAAAGAQASGQFGEDGSFTHLVISQRLKHVMNSLCLDFPETEKRGVFNPACMNPGDLTALGLNDGDIIRLESEYDGVSAVVKSAPEMKSGVIGLAHCFGEAGGDPDDPRKGGSNAGRLIATDQAYDPATAMCRQSAIPVRVRAL